MRLLKVVSGLCYDNECVIVSRCTKHDVTDQSSSFPVYLGIFL